LQTLFFFVTMPTSSPGKLCPKWGPYMTVHAFPTLSDDDVTLVQIVPDWADPERRRWLLTLRARARTVTQGYESEQEARLRAFLATGVGDFLAGVTWVRLPALRRRA
jgi:hypothetical protein